MSQSNILKNTHDKIKHGALKSFDPAIGSVFWGLKLMKRALTGADESREIEYSTKRRIRQGLVGVGLFSVVTTIALAIGIVGILACYFALPAVYAVEYLKDNHEQENDLNQDSSQSYAVIIPYGAMSAEQLPKYISTTPLLLELDEELKSGLATHNDTLFASPTKPKM